MENPTCEQLFDEDGVKRVSVKDDASWRHGVYRTAVYHRASDDTYWQASYRLSSDGETNELREGMAQILQVIPVQQVTIVYQPIGEPS